MKKIKRAFFTKEVSGMGSTQETTIAAKLLLQGVARQYFMVPFNA